MTWRPYPVVNLGQAGQDMITTKDFNAFFNFALVQASSLATIARAHDLSDDEQEQVRRAVGNIQQYTVPMTACPAQPAPAPLGTCPVCPPAPAAGLPWWIPAIVGLGIGGAVAGFVL